MFGRRPLEVSNAFVLTPVSMLILCASSTAKPQPASQAAAVADAKQQEWEAQKLQEFQARKAERLKANEALEHERKLLDETNQDTTADAAPTRELRLQALETRGTTVEGQRIGSSKRLTSVHEKSSKVRAMGIRCCCCFP